RIGGEASNRHHKPKRKSRLHSALLSSGTAKHRMRPGRVEGVRGPSQVAARRLSQHSALSGQSLTAAEESPLFRVLVTFRQAADAALRGMETRSVTDDHCRCWPSRPTEHPA